MEKILTIDGRQVKFKSTGAFLLRYKAQFKRDALKDVFRLIDSFDINTREIKNIEVFDLEVFYNIIWTLAKTADPNIPLPIDWLDGFSKFPLEEILPEIMDLVTDSFSSTVPSKKK